MNSVDSRDLEGSPTTGRKREPAESRLALLSSAAGPLRRTLATLAARLLDTRAYEPLCYARISDYARERLGLSARQLHDLAHVHRALASLAVLERALLANTLPWSKVRLVARVATAADEEVWIARARALPIRRLEAEVRASAPPGAHFEPDDACPRTRVTVHCTPAVHEKWLLAHELAERVAGQRLRADEALEWITAEACSAAAIEPAPMPGPDDRLAPHHAGAARPDSTDDDIDDPEDLRPLRGLELPAIGPLLDGLEEADAFELDRRLRLAVRLEQTLDAAMAPLLRVVTSPGYEWSGRRLILETAAAERLGMSASKARALLRIERAGDACPELRDAFRAGRLSWAKAQCLVPLLLLDLEGEWRPRWVKWAERVTVRRLEADVKRALLLRAGHDLAWHRCKFHPERAQDPIPEPERQKCAPEIDTEATERLVWRVPSDVAWLFGAVCESFRARLRSLQDRPTSDGQAFAALLDHALATWTARDPGAARPDPVIDRDGYRCAVPGCSARRNLQDHHVVFRSAGGSNAPDNRVTLCAFHHHRCLHAGRLRVRGRAPGDLVFELGIRPGHPPLGRYRSGDVVLPTPAVDPRTPRPIGPAARLAIAAAP